ncbi:MAG: UDP-glucose 4-epimerase GalE [Bacteroidia bacterium]
MKGKILVTGGTGYIGSHTSVELILAGFEVFIVDSLENSYIEVLDGIKRITGKKPKFHNLQLHDSNQVKEFFLNNNDFDGIIHFAAFKAVGESVIKPLKYYHNNLIAFLEILNNIQGLNKKNLIFSSSCTVYGEPNELPVSEYSPLQKPTSPYGNTKKMAEEILQDVCTSSDLQCISLRYFNPVGAHRSAEIGELPIGVPNSLIPFITQTAAGLRPKITVYGSDYPTPDGTCIRDYIHVVDLAKAHVKAIDRLLNKKNEKNLEVYNLGTGNGFSVLEVIKAFERATGQKLNYEMGPRRPGDVIAVYGDTTLATEQLGWKAEETLDSMMASAWKWQLKIPELYPNLQS